MTILLASFAAYENQNPVSRGMSLSDTLERLARMNVRAALTHQAHGRAGIACDTTKLAAKVVLILDAIGIPHSQQYFSDGSVLVSLPEHLFTPVSDGK